MVPAPSVPSLRALSSSVLGGEPFGRASAAFLDALAPLCARDGGWWAIPGESFADPPLPLPDPVAAAWMSGIAEHLAQASSAEPPAWCADPSYFLAVPVFACAPGGEAAARVTTPSALARRNLFCGPVTAPLFVGAGRRTA